MTTSEELERALSELVREATFTIPKMGTLSAADLRRLCNQSLQLDLTLAQTNLHNLTIDERKLSSFVQLLLPLLREFLSPTRGRIGNGLFAVTGGPGSYAQPTPEEFARFLLLGAIRLGAKRATALLVGWVHGEPLRSRHHALIDGIRVDQPTRLEGIELSMMSNSRVELPLFLRLPFREQGVGAASRLDQTAVLSLDLEHRPALYKPKKHEMTIGREKQLETATVNPKLQAASIQVLCEGLALASAQYASELAAWSSHQELDAFMGNIGGGGSYRVEGRALQKAQITADDLRTAIDICSLRSDATLTPEHDRRLDLAIRRWMNSLGPRAVHDKLIELRIALEAIYSKERERNLGAGIALRGAWHLGETLDERVEYRETLRKAYSDASSVIHAAKPKYCERDGSLLERSQEACRQGLLKILREGRPAWDNLVIGG